MKYYMHRTTKEEVYEDDWTNYAMKQLGITIKPVGKHAEMTKEQYEFIDTFTNWYFDGWDWTLKSDIERYEDDYERELEDSLYTERIERMMEEGY